jgi:hypothetical protein
MLFRLSKVNHTVVTVATIRDMGITEDMVDDPADMVDDPADMVDTEDTIKDTADIIRDIMAEVMATSTVNFPKTSTFISHCYY